MYVIAAVARNGAIGVTDPDGTCRMPWPRLQADTRWFQALTTAANPVRMARHWIRYPRTIAVAGNSWSEALWHTDGNVMICGWKTAQTLPLPLRNRIVIILRDQTSHGAGDWPCKARSFSEAYEKATVTHGAPTVFAIGGSQVYTMAMQHDSCEGLFLTEVDAEYPEATTWWPTDVAWRTGVLQCCGVRYHRHMVSDWIEEPDRPPYRFGIWGRTPCGGLDATWVCHDDYGDWEFLCFSGGGVWVTTTESTAPAHP